MSVVLSTEMSIMINDLLEKKFGYPKRRIFDPEYFVFTEEQLQQFDSLEIVNFGSIADLVHFPHLRSLSLKGSSYNNILPEVHYDDCSIINHITDFSPLRFLTNLEELIIENDLHIETLDLTPFSKLRTLIIVNNPLLKDVKGLDQLLNLECIIMYGNAITTPLDVPSFAYNTRLSKTNILDIGMYLPMIGYSREGAKKLKDLEISGISKVSFAEKSGFLSFTKINPQNLYDMYVKLDTMFKRSNAYELSDEEKVGYVYAYLLKNINFSHELIERRDNEYTDALERYKELPDRLKPSLASIHSGFRTYYFKSGNCEGFVNLMVFMLKMLGIEAYDVHCHNRQAEASFGSNHAIVRVHLNGKIYYCDPTFDRKHALNYLLVDYDTITQFHELDSFEHQLYLQTQKEDKYVI